VNRRSHSGCEGTTYGFGIDDRRQRSTLIVLSNQFAQDGIAVTGRSRTCRGTSIFSW
jgi:hypothetical protein